MTRAPQWCNVVCMANTLEGKKFADNLAGVIKASERLAIGTEIIGMIDQWQAESRQLEISGAADLVAHVKLTAKCAAAREIMEMLAARGVRDIGGLSS